MSKTKLYRVWTSMNRRCKNENDVNYRKYGAKGICVTEEWSNKNPYGFINFFKWASSNGYKDGLSIDRLNSQGNYEPTNCRWATFDEQNSHLAMNKNNKSGYTGVCWSNKENKWVVVISINNKSKRIGSFKRKEDAVNARNIFINDNHLLRTKQKYIGERGYSA